jgi:UTP--glucose-1-phosphate uridylyltransferase
MTLDPFSVFADKMSADGLSRAAIRAFEGNFRALQQQKTGMIPEGEIEPATDLPHASALPEPSPARAAQLLAQTVVIKLNGGLGTGMGLEKAKSLLPVRDGVTFLDLIARQILHQRGPGSAPKFVLMNSFSTSADTRAFLTAYPQLGSAEEIELMQNRVPKILCTDLSPAQCASQPDLEWCPPGHGDIYASLLGSGMLDRLLAAGITYAFVSNADNLGATLAPSLLAWFAASGAPFVMEVTARTENDKKGGHIARRTADQRYILRESAQCLPADEPMFQDIARHRFFNTNNLWIRLDHLREALAQHDGLIPLPMIRNEKTIDPRDKKSPKVYQLETAMGAAIECFPGAAAIEVSRERFAPVKTTADLLIIRSDACVVTDDHRLTLHPDLAGQPPVVTLDPDHYKLVDGLDALTPHGVPSLRACTRLTVQGRWTFAAGARAVGDVTLVNAEAQPKIALDPALSDT